MPVIKVTDMAYGNCGRRTSTRRRSSSPISGWCGRTGRSTRSTCGEPILPITSTSPEKGDPGFIGMAYYAASEEDLHKVARVPEPRASRTSTSPAGASASVSRNPTAIRSRWCGASSSCPRFR